MNLHQVRGDTWELAWRSPAPGGAPLRSVAGFSEQSGRSRQTVEPASVAVRLIILLDHTVTVTTGGGAIQEVRSFVAGPRASPVVVDQPGSCRGIEVGLSVVSASALVGMPLGELGGSIVALDDLLDDRARELHDRLGQAASWTDAFGVVDSCLRPGVGSPVDERLRWAWAAVRRSGGQMRVGSIAGEVGWSRRHLASRFEQTFGVTPKVAARLFRFERATSMLTTGTPPAEAATICGYFDQAHMHRDFALFGGRTPGQVAASRRTGGLEAAWPQELP
jgi:AraC-like DNA-binding protein